MIVFFRSVVCGMLAPLIGGTTLAGQQAFASDNAAQSARVITREQYRCLMKYRDEIVVSKRGTVIDLASCPPKPVLGAFPQRASERYLLLTPQDLACIKKIRPGEKTIVRNRDDAKVEIFLRPCGVS